MGFFEQGDFYDQEDLNLFFANYTPYIPQGTHPIPNFVDGGVAPGNVSQSSGESNLDFLLAYSLVYPQKLVLYQTDDINYSGTNQILEGYNTFLDAIDGVGILVLWREVVTLTNVASRTAHTQLMERQAMIQYSILLIRILQATDTRGS